MALILSETFASGIPAGFAVSVDDSSPMTATYNAGQQAVDLVKGGFNSAWRIDACPARVNSRVVLDLEQVSADNGGSSASGFGVAWGAASETFTHHLWLGTENSVVARTRGAAGFPVSAAADEGSTPTEFPVLSGRHTYEFACLQSPDGLRRQYQVRIDGVIGHLGGISTIPFSDVLAVYIFLRDCSYRLHQIDVYDAGTYVAPLARIVSGVGRLSPGGPGDARWRAAGNAYRHDSTDGGPLRIVGDVGIKAEDGGTGALVTGVDGNQIQPLRRRVRLLQRLTARLVREAWSNPATGAYEFTGLKDQDYLVIVDDYALVYNAVAADAVRPTP